MKRLLSVTLLAAALALGGAASAQDAAKKAQEAGCMKCHDVEKKKMGASFKSIAAKYKGNKDAEKSIVAKLKSGEGHPKGNAAEADLAAITQWEKKRLGFRPNRSTQATLGLSSPSFETSNPSSRISGLSCCESIAPRSSFRQYCLSVVSARSASTSPQTASATG